VKNLFKRNKVVSIITGLISLIYWFIPVFQQLFYENILDRANDYGGILYFPVMVFQGFYVISHTIPYFVQFFAFAITWILLVALGNFIVSVFTSEQTK